jgi:hypothetical protein
MALIGGTSGDPMSIDVENESLYRSPANWARSSDYLHETARSYTKMALSTACQRQFGVLSLRK